MRLSFWARASNCIVDRWLSNLISQPVELIENTKTDKTIYTPSHNDCYFYVLQIDQLFTIPFCKNQVLMVRHCLGAPAQTDTTTDVVNMGNYSQHDAPFNLARDQSQLNVVRMR